MNLSLRPFLILIAMLAWVAVPEAQAQRNRRGTSKELGVQLGTTFAAIGLAYAGMSSGVQPLIYFQF